MYDLGGADAHGNGMEYTDHASYSSLSPAWTVAAWVELEALVGGSDVLIFAHKEDFTAAKAGWTFGLDTSERVQVYTADGIGVENDVSTSALTVDGIKHCIMAVSDDTTIDFYLDGAADGTPAHTRDMGDSANPLTVGCRDAGSLGAAVLVGHCALWNDELTAAEIQQYYNGSSELMPSQDSLVAWDKCLDNLGLEEIQDVAAATVNGTVTQHANAVDTYYIGGGDWSSFMLDSWLPPLIASGLFNGLCYKMDDIIQIWKKVQALKGTRVWGAHPEELKRLLRALNEWKKPRIFMRDIYAT
jgi:hypothetical protein